MPIDARIPLGITPVSFANRGLEGLQTAIDTQARQQTLRDKQRAEREQIEVQRILTETNGDWEDALPRIRQVSPGLALKIQTDLTDERKKRVDMVKVDLENDLMLTQRGLGILRTIPPGDDEIYQAVKPLLLKLDPELGPLLPARYDQARLDLLQNKALTAIEYANKQRHSLELWTRGEPREAVAMGFETAFDATEHAEMLQGWRELGVPKILLKPYERWTPDFQQRAAQLSMSPKERAELAGQAETRGRMAESAAEVARHNLATEGTAATVAARMAAAQAETARHNRVMEGQGAASTQSAGASAALPPEYVTALNRATLNIPQTRWPRIRATVEAQAASGDLEGVKDTIRQAAVETEPVDSRNQIIGRLSTVAALRDIQTQLRALKAAGVNTNLLRGGAEDVARRLGTSTDPRLARIGTQIRDSFIQYRRSITGAAFSEQEARDYERLSPNYQNTLPLNEALIDGLLQSMATRDREFWTRKLGPSGAKLVGALPGESTTQAPAPQGAAPGGISYQDYLRRKRGGR